MKTELNRLNILRGLAAWQVAIGHTINCLNNHNMIFEAFFGFGEFGDLAVCYFFLISSMGMAYGFEKKSNYLNGFLKRKIGKIIAAIIMFLLVSEVIASLLSQHMFSLYSIGHKIIHLQWNWYLNEIIIFYILFYIAYRFGNEKKTREIIVVAGTLVICIAALLIWKYTDLAIKSRSYYTSALSFPLGVVLYDYWDKFESVIKKKPIICGACLFGIASICLFSYLMPEDSFMFGVLMKNMIGICLMLFLTEIMYFWDIFKMGILVPILNFFATISFEIFLYHGLVIGYTRAFFESDVVFIIVMVVLTTLISVVLNWITKYLKIILGKLKKSLCFKSI